MILLVQNDVTYENDLRSMLTAFFPVEKVRAASPREVADFDKSLFSEFSFSLTVLYDDTTTRMRLEEGGHVLYTAYTYGLYTDRKRFRNRLKLATYRLLSNYTKRTLPWGSLTGVRPTKIATAAIEKDKTREEIIEYYKYTYDTSDEKARLATAVAVRERDILETVNVVSDYCLYIGIPFCPTRCLYCSFAAIPIYENESIVGDYIETLKTELAYISFLNRNRRLVAIYIGGGTPTSLSAGQLNELLSFINETFNLDSLREFTVEAGRPDSITMDKLETIKKNGVTRISINPQTMNYDTLRIIGRAHTPADIKRAMADARKAGFKNINMDIIAGLPNEDIDDMAFTLREIEDMEPESLTVHSLAVKRAADLNQEYSRFRNMISKDTDEMLSLAAKKAAAMKMKPYYLYRQKNIAGNLENVGYAKEGLECLYNVFIMEEKMDIFAAGAGAVTRLLSTENGEVVRVDRAENVKNVEEYISRIDEMLERKQTGLDNRTLG